MGIDKDIARALRKPVPEDKMREGLLKLRKGATAWLTFGKMIQVLDKLGWQVAPFVGWTPLHYMYDGREQLVTTSSSSGYDRNPITGESEKRSADDLQRQHVEHKAAEHTKLPTDPSVGDVVVMDVGPIKKGAGDDHYYQRKQWVGAEGVTITSPRGDEESFLPGRHDLRRGTSVVDMGTYFPHQAWRWLREAGIEKDILAALEMEEHVPAEQRTRENTGTCAFCWGNYKLEGRVLVLHGYRRPGVGYVMGECPGRRRPPLETSVEGAQLCHDSLERQLGELTEYLAKLNSGEVEVIEVRGFGNKTKTVKKGEPEFKRLLGDRIGAVEQDIKQTTRDLDLYAKIVAAWRERPMPKEGEPQRGPEFFLK